MNYFKEVSENIKKSKHILEVIAAIVVIMLGLHAFPQRHSFYFLSDDSLLSYLYIFLVLTVIIILVSILKPIAQIVLPYLRNISKYYLKKEKGHRNGSVQNDIDPDRKQGGSDGNCIGLEYDYSDPPTNNYRIKESDSYPRNSLFSVLFLVGIGIVTCFKGPGDSEFFVQVVKMQTLASFLGIILMVLLTHLANHIYNSRVIYYLANVLIVALLTQKFSFLLTGSEIEILSNILLNESWGWCFISAIIIVLFARFLSNMEGNYYSMALFLILLHLLSDSANNDALIVISLCSFMVGIIYLLQLFISWTVGKMRYVVSDHRFQELISTKTQSERIGKNIANIVLYTITLVGFLYISIKVIGLSRVYGGLWGKGLGRGSSRYLDSYTLDLILEELGLWGLIFIILLFMLLFHGILVTLYKTENKYHEFILIGVFCYFLGAIVVSFLQLFGVAIFLPEILPFLMANPAMLVLCMSLIGLYFNISHHTNRGDGVGE